MVIGGCASGSFVCWDGVGGSHIGLVVVWFVGGSHGVSGSMVCWGSEWGDATLAVMMIVGIVVVVLMVVVIMVEVSVLKLNESS